MRRYKISRQKNAGFFDSIKDFFGLKSKEQKLALKSIKDAFEKMGLKTNNLKIFKKNDTMFLKNGDQLFAVVKSLDQFENKIQKDINDFLNNMQKALKINNPIDVTNISKEYVENLQNIQTSSILTLVKIS